jgi:Styrene monooxygenase A putative substrate binding domain
MRRIAVIGSGQTGLLAAHGLLQAGCEVTLFSDRSGEDWLRSCKPTGTASRFEQSLDFERSLGLNHWEDDVPKIRGAHITLCNSPGNPLLTLLGRLAPSALTIDVRMQSERWMADLTARGGRVVVESVTVPRLDAIAAEHDLTVVASGKGELARLFPRDAARSRYDKPARSLALAIFRSERRSVDGSPFLPVKFNILDGAGEGFFTPFFHKDHGAQCWSALIEAVPGGPLDRFAGVKDGRAALEAVRGVFRDFFPWDADFFDGAKLADEHGWLVGSITPTVRNPVGRLPSGRLVTGLGDTVVALDPIGGQGANSGSKMAQNLVESVARHGERAFDEAWMTSTFERYWERHGRPTCDFNNSFLEPPSLGARLMLLAQYGSDGLTSGPRQQLADAFVGNFIDPARLTDTVLNPGKARAFISETMGAPWLLPVLRGGLAVAAGQIRQKLGMTRHPPALPARAWAASTVR